VPRKRFVESGAAVLNTITVQYSTQLLQTRLYIYIYDDYAYGSKSKIVLLRSLYSFAVYYLYNI